MMESIKSQKPNIKQMVIVRKQILSLNLMEIIGTIHFVHLTSFSKTKVLHLKIIILMKISKKMQNLSFAECNETSIASCGMEIQKCLIKIK